jgi:phage-related protein
VHTVLKRLNESGEIRFITSHAGAKSYIWQKPATVAAIGPEVAEFVRKRQRNTDGRRRKEKT